MKHLSRTIYRTDVDESNPDYIGMFSASIPDRALEDSQIVNVDWSERGWVEVTYLVPGPGYA